MKCEWDPAKAATNLRKHKISFEEAAMALADDLSLTGSDPDHSTVERRFVTFGMSAEGQLLAVSHTERGDVLRIIGARRATRHERKVYEEG